MLTAANISCLNIKKKVSFLFQNNNEKKEQAMPVGEDINWA